MECVRAKQEKELKNFETQEKSIQGKVIMLNYVKNGIIMKRSQDRHPVIETIKEIVERCGYSFEYRLFQEQFEHVENLIAECREKDVKESTSWRQKWENQIFIPFRTSDTDRNRR